MNNLYMESATLIYSLNEKKLSTESVLTCCLWGREIVNWLYAYHWQQEWNHFERYSVLIDAADLHLLYLSSLDSGGDGHLAWHVEVPGFGS